MFMYIPLVNIRIIDAHTWQDSEIRLDLSLAFQCQPHAGLSGLARHLDGSPSLWSCESNSGAEGAQASGPAAHLEGPSQEMRHFVVCLVVSWAQKSTWGIR